MAVLAAGWFTDVIGVFSVFGGFVAGLAMPVAGCKEPDCDHRRRDAHLPGIDVSID
jgi:hypothetical protein